MGWLKDNKTEIQLVTALLLCLFGCTLLAAGFVVAPLGLIEHSVLIAFGEIMTFAGALFGIDYVYKYRMFQKNKEDKEDKDTDK